MTCLQCGEQTASYPCKACGYSLLVSLAPLDTQGLNAAAAQAEPTPREAELEQEIKRLNSRIGSLQNNHVNLFIPGLFTLLFSFGVFICGVLTLNGYIDGKDLTIVSMIVGGIITIMGVLSVVFSSSEAF